jgi:hypothetical protein
VLLSRGTQGRRHPGLLQFNFFVILSVHLSAASPWIVLLVGLVVSHNCPDGRFHTVALSSLLSKNVRFKDAWYQVKLEMIQYVAMQNSTVRAQYL